MSTINYDIKGYDDLLKELTRLPDQMQKKHVWGAALAGATIIKNKAIENAKRIDKPARKGEVDSQIFPNIKAKRAGKKAKNIPGGAAYRIGVEGGAEGKTRTPPSYWRHVEFGTEDTPAQPFLRPAIEQSAGEVTQRVAQSLWDRIQNEINKGGV